MKYIKITLLSLFILNNSIFCEDKKVDSEKTFFQNFKENAVEVFDFSRCVALGYITGNIWLKETGKEVCRIFPFISEEFANKWGINFKTQVTNSEIALRYATILSNYINITKPFNFGILKRFLYTILGITLGVAFNGKNPISLNSLPISKN